MVDPVHRDPFSGELITPNPLDVSDEQKENIRAILDLSSSDSRFALKAYLAIMKLLLGADVTPVILSLEPTEGNSGVPNLALTVHGTDFEAGSRVQQAGVIIPTSYVDNTELRATVNLSGAAPGVMAISVRNSSGITSNIVNLDVLDPLTLLEQDGIIGSLSSTRASRQVSDAPANEITDYDDLMKKIAEINTGEGINPPYEPVSTEPIPNPSKQPQEDNPFTPQDDTQHQPVEGSDAPIGRFDAAHQNDPMG